jgi:hypothetical protein
VLSAMMRTTAFSATSVPMFHSTATFVVRALRRFLSFLKAPHPLYVPVFDFSRARVEKVPDSSHLYHRELFILFIDTTNPLHGEIWHVLFMNECACFPS